MDRQEFEHHGLGDVVTLVCRDVCNEGFGLVNAVDAGTVCIHNVRGLS